MTEYVQEEWEPLLFAELVDDFDEVIKKFRQKHGNHSFLVRMALDWVLQQEHGWCAAVFAQEILMKEAA